MNHLSRTIAIVVLTLLVLGCFAEPVSATDGASSPTCFAATFLQSIAGDRSKIIQLSIVFVLIGMALLFKK